MFLFPGDICNISLSNTTQIQFITELCQIYQNLFYINLFVFNSTAFTSLQAVSNSLLFH